MTEGEINLFEKTKEMVLTTTDKENQRDHHDVARPPMQQVGKPLTTINGPMKKTVDIHSKDMVIGSSSEGKILPEAPLNRYQSLFRISSEDSYDDLDETGRMMPGLLGEGIAYTVKETLMQGWIEKKGSGFDWIGSRAWKKRWAVLVKARTDGHNVDVPLLQIFWDYHSLAPSTVISLDSVVLLPENIEDPTKADNNHPFRFKISHVKKSVNPEIAVQLTRTLGCSEESERDEWVYKINRALLNYEKEKANARRLNTLSLSPPRGSSRSWANEDVMPRSNPSPKRIVHSPPRIPLSLRK